LGCWRRTADPFVWLRRSDALPAISADGTLVARFFMGLGDLTRPWTRWPCGASLMAASVTIGSDDALGRDASRMMPHRPAGPPRRRPHSPVNDGSMRAAPPR
jgi:hypothetical protein